MNSLTINSSINNNQSILDNKKYFFTTNLNNSNNIIYSFNSKNKSRNNKHNLYLPTDSNLKDNNNIRTFYNTSNNIKAHKKPSLFLNNFKKKAIKIKKDLFKKKIKEIFKNIENNENKSIFKNKEYLFEEISHDKEKVPKVKTQEQLNYYLINDFKEKEPMKIEIKKSKKNGKIDEEFDIYKAYLREKQYHKNIFLIKEYKRKNEIKIDNKIEKSDNKIIKIDNKYEKSDSLNINEKKNMKVIYKRKSKKKMTCYRPVVFYNDIYKNYYKNKEKENCENFFNKSNNNNHSFHRYDTRIKTPSKKSREIFHFNSPKKRKSSVKDTNIYNHSLSKDSNNNIFTMNNIKHFSKNENIYKEEKKKYNKYLKKLGKIRSKVYLEKIKKLEMEENNLKDDNKNNEWTEEKKIKLTELNEERLLIEIKKKNIFLDSFGIAGKNINDKEDDIDEDNFKGLKNYHMNIGMGSKYMNNLKLKIEPRYILKHFKKKTIEKYKGNKGIFFGAYNPFEKIYK